MLASATRPPPGSSLDLSAVKLDAQRRLLALLNKLQGTKTIVFDDKLIGPFEFVASASLLKSQDATRLFRLSDIKTSVPATTDHTLFFIRRDYQAAKLVAAALQKADRLTMAKTSLVLVPQRCTSIEKLLQHNKVDLDKLNAIEELDIELFVLDTDVLSMENERVYRDLYLKEDYSAIHQIVQGLTKLQELYGPIRKISGQGKGAKLVCDLMLKRRKLHPPTGRATSQIHHLILIDRRIDLVTPLLTQLTYEGLLDEVFGISHGTIVLPADKFRKQPEAKAGSETEPPPKSSETKRFELRSSEELYGRLRDSHINGVADVLKQSARNLQAEYEECNSQGKTIHEIGKIVKRLNNLKVAKNSQSNHVAIAELVNEQTLRPDFIYGLRVEHELLQDDKTNRVMPDIDIKLLRQENPLHVLRLICLQSMLNNGLKAKVVEHYKRELVQNYGQDYILFLMQLEQASVLLDRERYLETGTFNQLKSKFGLINDNVDECNPNHPSYVYGGYTPLSVAVTKILAQLGQAPSRSASENLKLLPEPTVTYSERTQKSNNTTAPLMSSYNQNSNGFIAERSSYAVMSTPIPISAPNPSSSAQSAAASVSTEFSSSLVAAGSLLLSAGAAAAAAGGSAAAAAAGSLRVRRNSVTSSQSSSEDTRSVLVFFIGGCTFAEISALRFLSQQEENNCDFTIGTSKIINGRTFLHSMSMDGSSISASKVHSGQ